MKCHMGRVMMPGVAVFNEIVLLSLVTDQEFGEKKKNCTTPGAESRHEIFSILSRLFS